LNLILEVGKSHPKSIHVSFSFGYDVNMILKDLSERALYVLHEKGTVYWRDYHIEHVPRKWITIRRTGWPQVKIFDVFLFFNCKFGIALRKYKVGTNSDLDRIDTGKEERPNFTWSNIDEIELYWETELKYGVELMDKLREIIYGAEYFITSWHGPGALASYALNQHNVQWAMDKGVELPVNEAARYAMFGGRFQAFQAGYYEGTIYDRDINSAYAYAFSRLPNLATGKWRYNPYPDRESVRNQRMGLYHIRFFERRGLSQFNPLPHREHSGEVCFPSRTEGWFHASEAASVWNNPNAEFIESWEFDDDGTFPFEWILEEFEKRLEMQKEGNPCEKTVKWMLAALYGQAAQRAGWIHSGKAPKWHQIEWAGAVTAECRAMIYSAASITRQSLISIDTDGFIALAPVNRLPNGIGENLGQWKCEEYTGILYLQNGIYWLKNADGTWQSPKSRGIPRKKLDFDQVYDSICANKSLEIYQHMFIGYGLALRGQMQKWRKWIDVPRTIEFGGGGKAFHSVSICPVCKAGKNFGEALHPLFARPAEFFKSAPYNLPWLNEERDIIENHTEV
jgi:DNA polymerase type B, organellar and viral